MSDEDGNTLPRQRPTRGFRKTTIKDVAEKAGVSTTTVSLLLSGRAGVCSPETEQRVRRVIADLHYSPGPAVRGLRQRASHVIGACFAAPGDEFGNVPNSFSERLWRGVYGETNRAGYGMLTYPAVIREDVTAAEAFLDGKVDGLIFCPLDTADCLDSRPATLARAGLPTVLLLRQAEHIPSGCVGVDADQGDIVRLAMEHLWLLGHRRIGHLYGPIGNSVFSKVDAAIDRHDFARGFLSARGAYDPALFLPGGPWEGDRGLAADAVRTWQRMDSPPTAVLCANDEIAIVLIQVAKERGWSVPGDLSVVGIDNLMASAECDPPLTTVDVPANEIGKQAVRHLLTLMKQAEEGAGIEAKGQVSFSISVTELVIRGSTREI